MITERKGNEARGGGGWCQVMQGPTRHIKDIGLYSGIKRSHWEVLNKKEWEVGRGSDRFSKYYSGYSVENGLKLVKATYQV